MASSKVNFLPMPGILFKFVSRPPIRMLFSVNCPCIRNTKLKSAVTSAVYSKGLPLSSNHKSVHHNVGAMIMENDPISMVNERIRRDHGMRDTDAARPRMDSKEAEMYIQLVKEQQQKGLQKLKGTVDNRGGEGGAKLSYKADPYTLKSGDYVVHKKVGIGRFVGIKFDVPRDSSEPIEYVFIEYADGMARLPLKQASRMLYRYNLPNETKRPRTLSKLSDRSTWERRRTKGKVAVQKME